MTDDHKPVTAYDVSDENPAFLARRIDSLANEMRNGFELLVNKIADRILPELLAIKDGQADDRQRIADLERGQDEIRRQIAALAKPKRKARK